MENKSGILLVDKEAGITTYDIIRKLKPLFPRGKKIGHAGTLDPFATGLVVVLIGKATKKSMEIMKTRKIYTVTAEFGYEMDTHDPTGKIVHRDENPEEIDHAQIEAALEKFKGKIMQMPPAFSAKKVGGKRAYDLARKGEKFKLEAREIEIFRYEIVNYNWPKVKFEVECSSGTYVRTLIVDLGRELKTFATPVELRRLAVGDYRVEDAIGSGEIENKLVEKRIEVL